MKKLLLTGAAFVAFAATPAMAEGLSLDLAGHFKGYGVYTDADTDDLREFNFRKDTEVHFTGETTLDSGLTVGVHVETQVDGDTVAADEAYMYASGGWGRVNFGEEDGAAYLLQVAAPSADANVDGIRQFISASELGELGYDHADAKDANKLTYMTPVFNGFQAGASYTAAVTDSANGTTSTSLENDGVNEGLDDGYELAARYEAEVSGVGVTVGAGYSNYGNETDAVVVENFTDNLKTWNAGLGLGFGDVNVGVAYKDSSSEVVGVDVDYDQLVVGADYTMGAYKVGASYMDASADVASLLDLDGERYTVGGSYAYGPGMSFRGSISHIDADASFDETQVLVGTQVNF